MAKPRMDLSAFVGKLLEEQDGDVLREGIRVLSQALMETEVAGLIGAERHERTEDRTAYRNGARTRTWDTRMGTIELAIPKVRPGTYFPSLLQPRRRAEHALPGGWGRGRFSPCLGRRGGAGGPRCRRGPRKGTGTASRRGGWTFGKKRGPSRGCQGRGFRGSAASATGSPRLFGRARPGASI